MQDVGISQIHFDGANGIRLVPVAEVEGQDNDYAAVDRAANGVRWDHEAQSLVMAPPPDDDLRSPLKAFQQIALAVASEYGQRLVLTAGTTFHYVAPADRAEIHAWQGVAEPAPPRIAARLGPQNR